VDVATYGDRGRDGLDVGLFHKNASDGVAEDFHVCLWEMLAVHELVYPFVRVVWHGGGEQAEQARCGKSRTWSPNTTRSLLATPIMQLLRCLLSLSIFTLTARAIHESEVGIVDWHTKLVGVPLYTSPLTKPVFHDDIVLTATSNNVLAALRASDGSIGLLGFVLRVSDRDLNACSVEKHTRRSGCHHGVQSARRECVSSVPLAGNAPSDPISGVHALSGPAGSTLRVYDVSTGDLVHEKQLHNPAEGKKHEPPTLGLALALVRAQGGDRAIILTNGDTLQCVHSSTGETVWQWRSEDHG